MASLSQALAVDGQASRISADQLSADPIGDNQVGADALSGNVQAGNAVVVEDRTLKVDFTGGLRIIVTAVSRTDRSPGCRVGSGLHFQMPQGIAGIKRNGVGLSHGNRRQGRNISVNGCQDVDHQRPPRSDQIIVLDGYF